MIRVRCVFDAEGRFVEVDQQCARLFGYTPEELLGRRYMDLVVPEDRELTGDVAIQIMNGAVIENFENYYGCKDGQKRILWWARWNREEERMHCIAMDADQLDRYAKPDPGIQKMYRAYRLVQIGWWEADAACQQFQLSDEVYLIYGLNREETPMLTRANFLELVHPDDRDHVAERLDSIKDLSNIKFEHRLQKPGGDVIYVIHYVQTERNASGDVVGVNGVVKNVTERRLQALQIERQRAETQRYADQLLDILESMDHSFFACDENLICTFCNEKAAKAFGLPKAEIIGRRVEEVICKDRVTPFCERLVSAIHAGRTMTYEAFSQKKTAWLEVSISRGSNGYSIYLKDVTERHRKDEELRISHERYAYLASMTHDIIWDANFETDQIDVHDSHVENLGREVNSASEARKAWEQGLHLDDREAILREQEEVLGDPARSTWQGQYRFRNADGTFVHLRDRFVVLRNSEGEVVRMIGAMQDITAQVEAEQSVAASERKFRAMVQSGKDLITIFDAGFNVRYLSPNHEPVNSHVTNGSRIGNALDRIHEDDLVAVQGALRRVGVEKEVEFPLYRFRADDGSWRWFDTVMANHLNDPDIAGIISNTRDVTETKEAEDELRLSEEKYKQLFTNSSIPKMIFADRSFAITDVNEAALAGYGYSREEFTRLTLYDLVNLDRKQLEPILRKYHDGNDLPFAGMVEHRVKGGRVINVEVASHPIQLPTGTQYILVANDITEKVRLQKQMVEEKVATQKAIIQAQEKERSEVGKELHDNVNQILATAKLYIENVNYYPEQSAQFVEKSAVLVQRAINEIRFLSKALVTPVMGEIGFRDTLLELINSYHEVNPFAIEHEFDFEEADVEQGLRLTIYRILQEQFNNTIKYAQASRVKIVLASRAGELVYRYADDGAGFDTSRRKAGLGLNNMRNRAEVHKGRMQIESAPGAGCWIEVRFPLEAGTN